MKAGFLFVFLIVATTSFKLPKYDAPLSEDDRIIGGMQTRPHAYPFMARISTYWPGLAGSCGGTLINSQWVLTAAHCVYILDKQLLWTKVIVTLGDHYTGFLDVNEVQINAEDVIIHENYINYGRNDVALIKLRTPAETNQNVQPGCLNGANNDYIGQDATAIGWGLTSTIDNYGSSVLKEATLPIVSADNCPGMDQQTMVCTGFIREVGQDTVFKGDSGGPLFLNNNGFNVVGVASYVTLDNNWPQRVTSAVFTKVSAHMDWIRQHIGGAELCINN